jgi:hypothetical protein
MNFGTLIKAFDTVMSLREMAKRVAGNVAPMTDSAPTPATGAGAAIAGQIEARLTNVVVAALKEAFERDHARLELERAQLEEQRRRAEEAMRQELRRQAADRELARLRGVSATALVGWIASVALFVARLPSATLPGKLIMSGGWLLLLAALAVAFSAQGNIGDEIAKGGDVRAASRPGSFAVWLLTAGLALAAASLMF